MVREQTSVLRLDRSWLLLWSGEIIWGGKATDLNDLPSLPTVCISADQASRMCEGFCTRTNTSILLLSFASVAWLRWYSLLWTWRLDKWHRLSSLWSVFNPYYRIIDFIAILRTSLMWEQKSRTARSGSLLKMTEACGFPPPCSKSNSNACKLLSQFRDGMLEGFSWLGKTPSLGKTLQSSKSCGGKVQPEQISICETRWCVLLTWAWIPEAVWWGLVALLAHWGSLVGVEEIEEIVVSLIVVVNNMHYWT